MSIARHCKECSKKGKYIQDNKRRKYLTKTYNITAILEWIVLTNKYTQNKIDSN